MATAASLWMFRALVGTDELRIVSYACSLIHAPAKQTAKTCRNPTSTTDPQSDVGGILLSRNDYHHGLTSANRLTPSPVNSPKSPLVAMTIV